MIRAALTLALFLIIASVPPGTTAQMNQPPERDDSRRMWFTVTIQPENVLTEGAYVGGQLVMDVQFISSDPFQRLRLTLPTIEGARTDVLVRPYTVQIARLGGKGYSHSARLAIVPLRAGPLDIPAIEIRGLSTPRGDRSFEFRRKHPARTVTVLPPDGVIPADRWVVSTKATVEETWSPPIESVARGDTVERRIRLTVNGVHADELPPLELNANTGYRVLNRERVINTEKRDTGFVATVEERWLLHVDTEAVFYVDGIAFRYWDPAAHAVVTLQADRRRVEPVLRDAKARRQQLRDGALRDHQTERWGVAALLGLPLLGALGVGVLALWAAVPSRADWQLWRAASRQKAPLEFYGEFLHWVRRTFGSQTRVHDQWVGELGGSATTRVRGMHDALFRPGNANFDQRRTALGVILAARRADVLRLVHRVARALGRFFFLR
ncbi:MAG: hypothetical protein AAF493_13140 [Pseudomonadota bacterium]